MDLLPLEITLKIFSLLNLNDLMTLRLVCKQFECIVRQVKIRELAFMKNSWFFDGDWFWTKELIDLSVIVSSNSYLLSSSSLSNGPFNVQFLKRLSVESLSDAKEIELKDINRLEYLEHLEIGFDRQPRKSSSMWSLSDQQLQKQLRQTTRLYLPNLKVLRIISIYNQKPGIEIDAPKLKALELPKGSKYRRACSEYVSYDPARLGGERFVSNMWRFTYEHTYKNDISSLNFKYSGRIQFLSIIHLEQYFKNPNFIQTFRNVEYLLVWNSWILSRVIPLLDDILPTLEKLKVVDLRKGSFQFSAASDVAHLVDWVVSLQRPDLKVYFMSIQVSNNPNLVQDFIFYQQASENDRRSLHKEYEYKLLMQLKNYSLLSDRVDSGPDLHYNKVVEKLRKMRADQSREQLPIEGTAGDRNDSSQETLFPNDFFERFPRIFSISSARIESEHDFARLVKNCKNLRSLSLKNSELSQAFFDQLPSISLLNNMQVKEINELNMNFLFRMNHLVYFITDQRLDWEIALKLAKPRHCKTIACKIKNRDIEIWRKPRDKFLLKIGPVEKKMVNSELLAYHLSSLEMAGPGTIVFEFFHRFWFELCNRRARQSLLYLEL